MLFFEFLDSLNEAHSRVKGMVNASEVREIKATILDVVGGDFKVRDMLQGYGIVVDCLSILRFDKPDDLSWHKYQGIKDRAFKDLLFETYKIDGGVSHD